MLWKLPDDMARFKRLTTGHTVVFGSATYRGMGGVALPNRNNVVVTREVPDGADCGMPRWLTHRKGGVWCKGMTQALDVAGSLENEKPDGEVFIAGGAMIYELALAEPRVSRIYLTRVHVTAETAFKQHRLEFVYFRLPKHDWQHGRSEFHPADGRHEYAFEFVQLDRR